MLNVQPLSFMQFIQRVSDLGISVKPKFLKSRPGGDPDHHDYILMYCNHALIGQVCSCCRANLAVNDYGDPFDETLTLDQYNEFLELLYHYSYTDPDYKAFIPN